MNLDDRISRRLSDGETSGPAIDHWTLDPAEHLEEPVGRGPVLERLLDCLEPSIDGREVEDTYVWGPPGSGKSAVVTALFEHLSRKVTAPPSSVFTSTRAASSGRTAFVYVDARTASSDFQLYRRVLTAVSGESVPEGGVSTAELRDRLLESFEPPGNVVVVAVDHVGDPETLPVAAVEETFSQIGSVGWLCVGRHPPEEVPEVYDRTVHVAAYQELALEDILSTRASTEPRSNALSHDQVRQVAAWADGNAHDGLAALFGAAEHARERGADAIDDPDIAAGKDAVPKGGAPVGRVLALPANRQAVLRALVDVDESGRQSVDEACQAVAGRPGIDLSHATVRRFIYELADWGILALVTRQTDDPESGRPPSRVEARFPTIVFRRLYDLRNGDAA